MYTVHFPTIAAADVSTAPAEYVDDIRAAINTDQPPCPPAGAALTAAQQRRWIKRANDTLDQVGGPLQFSLVSALVANLLADVAERRRDLGIGFAALLTEARSHQGRLRIVSRAIQQDHPLADRLVPRALFPRRLDLTLINHRAQPYDGHILVSPPYATAYLAQFFDKQFRLSAPRVLLLERVDSGTLAALYTSLPNEPIVDLIARHPMLSDRALFSGLYRAPGEPPRPARAAYVVHIEPLSFELNSALLASNDKVATHPERRRRSYYVGPSPRVANYLCLCQRRLSSYLQSLPSPTLAGSSAARRGSSRRPKRP